ncbi:MAG: 23S rRNA (uracil(1939)-C(5))-methyltransferase RlmD [candidate division WOR-3 bacterium]
MVNEFECNIEKVVYGGIGICSYNNIKVFVPYTAPDDKLIVKVKDRKHNYWLADIKKIITPSPVRTQPLCQYYTVCGGCSLQHINYQSQLKIKSEYVLESLCRIGHINIEQYPIITPSIPFHYRNKTQFPLERYGQKIGFYQRGSHRVVDITKCLLHPPIFDDLRWAIKQKLKLTKASIYNENNHTGNLRHLIIRQGAKTNEILIIFVTRTPVLERKIYDSLPAKFDNIVGIIQNINPERTNRILGRKNKILFGRDYNFEYILNKKFKISVNSFFQINTLQTENIVMTLRQLINSPENLLDLYCGVGLFSICLADKCKKVIGIELEQQAINDAIENLKINGINNVEFICGPVEKKIQNFGNIDTVIIDPPRKGCAEDLLLHISKLKPKQIIYISCNPTTLARDLAVLARYEYQLKELRLFDMFPQTFHIESMVKLVPK